MSKTMFYVGGCSGTSSPESSRHEFGNLTTSFGVVSGDEGVFIDNGSGIGKVASYLMENKVISVSGLQTHFHNDHIQGIQNNKLLFIPGLVKRIYAPKLCNNTFSDIFEEEFNKDKWPVSPKDFGIITEIQEYAPGDRIAAFCGIETLLQNHPVSGSIAYKLKTVKGNIVVSTDSEPVGEHADRLASFINGASVFYMDVQYRDTEYQGEMPICGKGKMKRVGWGHGTPSMLMDVLSKCKQVPKTVIIGHHDPLRTTGDLFVFEQEIKNLLQGFKCEVRFAREGDSVEL